MVFKVVNKDTGEVGDLRHAPATAKVPYDILPSGFVPGQAWHPELQVRRPCPFFLFFINVDAFFLQCGPCCCFGQQGYTFF